MLGISPVLRLLACAAVFTVASLLIPTVIGGPIRAQAFELFGVCWIQPCEEQESEAFLDPRYYEAELDIAPDTPNNVADAISGASAIWLGREKPVSGSAGLIARAKGDYRRILAALYNTGHYGGEISIRINGREAADIPTGTDLPDRPLVAIRVGPGTTYLFGKTTIINQAPPAFDRKDEVKLPQEIGYETGKPARASVVRQAASLSRESWRQQGHPKVSILSTDATANHPAGTLDVSINVRPGPRATYGELTVSGTEGMDPEFVAYMTGLEPGQEYDPDDLKKAQKRLDRLGVFSGRRIVEAEKVNKNGSLPLDIIVKERKLHRYGIGATLSSSDGLAVQSYWLHRNLFGRAEQLRFDGNVGGIGRSSTTTQLDYLLSATFIKPGVFTPDTDFSAKAYGYQEFNDTYDEKTAGAQAKLVNYFSDEVTLSGGLFGEYSRFSDVFGIRHFNTFGFEGEAIYDTRNNKADATSGYFLKLNARPYYEAKFSNPGATMEAEGRTYWAVDARKRTVLAGRVKLGSAVGNGIAQTAPSYLYTAGGGGSVRGYDYKSIGVPLPTGEVIAGKSLFEVSGEIRQRFMENFGVVGFVDAGTVGPDSWADFSQQMRVGAGLGLRYYTGLGPIRVDVAVPLNKRPGDPDFALYAGIGHAF